MKGFVTWTLATTAAFLLSSVEVTTNRGVALEQSLTLDRLLEAPTETFQKQLRRVGCSFQTARADLETDHSSKTSPGDCGCGGLPDSRASWNSCLGCLFVMFVQLYTSVSSGLSEAGIDPALDMSRSALVENANLTIVSGPSLLAGYERRIQILNANSGQYCINLHYAQDARNSRRVKAILHMDSANCPGDGSTDGHAMAMIFDLNYSDPNVQNGQFFHTGYYSGTRSDFNMADPGRQDDGFYMRINVDGSSGRPITTTHVLRLSQNTAWRYFMKGEDDVKFVAAQQTGVALTSSSVDATGMTSTCYNDATGATLADSSCSDSGYSFGDFPLSANDLRTKLYPTWTPTSLTVTAAATAASYF